MKKILLILFAVASIVLSRATFLLINDPEGPNLLAVTMLAVIIYAVLIVMYFLFTRAKMK